jgi:hypothetical protein
MPRQTSFCNSPSNQIGETGKVSAAATLHAIETTKVIMNHPTASFRAAARVACTLLIIAAAPVSSHANATGSPSPRGDVLAQAATPGGAPAMSPGAPSALPSNTTSWTFPASPSAGNATWVAERGRLTPGDGNAQLQPDSNRRVVLLSPSGLPDAVHLAEEFVLGLSGTGLQRVRIQGRRDASGGWITIADAHSKDLKETAEGYVVKRKRGARSAPIERLRIEIEFATTNPRTLQSIAAR